MQRRGFGSILMWAGIPSSPGSTVCLPGVGARDLHQGLPVKLTNRMAPQMRDELARLPDLISEVNQHE